VTLVVAGIVALIRTNGNLRGIEITSCCSDPAPAGDEVVLTIAVTNFSNRERLGFKVRFRDRWSLRGAGEIPFLHAGETRTAEMRLPTSRRGRFAIPAIWVSSNLPMGICFAWKIFRDAGKYHVYPRGRSWRQPATGVGQDGKAAGNRQIGTEDVSGHRAYVPGDLPARMDWKIYARTGHLAVRTFDTNSAGRTSLRWEDTAFLQNEEDRLEQLSFWVSESLRARLPFELHLGRRAFNERNISACRIALATFGEV